LSFEGHLRQFPGPAEVRCAGGAALIHPTLIDGRGEPWWAGAPELRRRFAAAGAFEDVSALAVREHGYVLLRERKGALHVALRPERVTRPALATLFFRLAEAKPTRLLLSHFGEEWTHEVCGNAHETMLRLEDLVAFASGWALRAIYDVERHPLIPRRHPSLRQLAPMLAVWHLLGGRGPDRLAEVLAPLGFLDRSAIIRRPKGTERVLFEHRGKAFTFYQPCWNLLAMGRDVEDQPDCVYGAHTARCYRETFAEDAPRFESVEALVRTPEREVRRSRFDRLILPWRTHSGERVATGISIVRASYRLGRA